MLDVLAGTLVLSIFRVASLLRGIDVRRLSDETHSGVGCSFSGACIARTRPQVLELRRSLVRSLNQR
jgi:hypothetical protein